MNRQQRQVTLLDAPAGTWLFWYTDIKQEIVHTLLLEEYGVSWKWVLIMDKKQDSKAALTQWPSAQDRYHARSSGGGAKKQRGRGEE